MPRVRPRRRGSIFVSDGTVRSTFEHPTKLEAGVRTASKVLAVSDVSNRSRRRDLRGEGIETHEPRWHRLGLSLSIRSARRSTSPPSCCR